MRPSQYKEGTISFSVLEIVYTVRQFCNFGDPCSQEVHYGVSILLIGFFLPIARSPETMSGLTFRCGSIQQGLQSPNYCVAQPTSGQGKDET
jgi:hypothetical protein